jgi:hypothetical protein
MKMSGKAIAKENFMASDWREKQTRSRAGNIFSGFVE